LKVVLPIDDRIERAVQLVLRARIFFDIWFYFEGADTRRGILDTMDEYSEFFRFAPHAHLVAFVVSISAVLDKRRGTISLFHLAEEMKGGNLLPMQVEKEIGDLLTQAEPLRSKIAILRHNAFAHRSAVLSYDDAFRMAAVTAGEMRDLTEIALKISNKLARARGLSEQFFNPLPRADAEEILVALRK
jgi:hypothetical protein